MAVPLENTSDAEDRQLVSAIVGGHHQAFAALIRKYEKLVMTIVFKMVSKKEDREDLCQDIFLKVYHKLDTFRFQSKLSTWIGSIAYNRTLNFLQKKKLVLLEDLQATVSAAELEMTEWGSGQLTSRDLHPEQLFLNKELGQKILAALDKLPLIQKTVIGLYHQVGLPLEEIGTITGLPVNTVKSHLFRGRKALRSQLEKM